MPFRFIAILALAAALLPPRPAGATTVEAPEFKDLIAQADYVVRGVVVSVASEWREHNGQSYIASQVEIKVSEVIKGTPPEKVVLEMVGGRVGDDQLIVEGAPKFLLGEEDIFFVHGNGVMLSPLVGIMHGLYPILHDFKSGRDYVLRSNGMPLYSEQDVALPMTRLSPVKADNPAAQPISAETFIRQIRQSAAPGRIRNAPVEN